MWSNERGIGGIQVLDLARRNLNVVAATPWNDGGVNNTQCKDKSDIAISDIQYAVRC
jgi:hypothetical protein